MSRKKYGNADDASSCVYRLVTVTVLDVCANSRRECRFVGRYDQETMAAIPVLVAEMGDTGLKW